ncbi:MAG: CAP domain-containing protein [bacterium]|nr:CAP domain-containing protein [bacterium]
MVKTAKKRPTTRAHKTRHHSNLRPKNKQSKDYLKHYYPYIPLISIVFAILSILIPIRIPFGATAQVLPYSTEMSSENLLIETNRQRTNNDLDALEVNDKLSEAAREKAEDMVERNYWSHLTPEGSSPWIFVNDEGYKYSRAGENLAYGFSNSEQVIAGWMNSESHKDNILDKDYQEVGFGYANSPNYDGKGKNTVVVAMYGTPSSVTNNILGAGSEKITNIGSLSRLPKTISLAELMSSGRIPQIQMIVVLLGGVLIGTLIMKNLFSLKRAIRRGERFVLHHPLFDITLIAGFVLLFLLSSSQGSII